MIHKQYLLTWRSICLTNLLFIKPTEMLFVKKRRNFSFELQSSEISRFSLTTRNCNQIFSNSGKISNIYIYLHSSGSLSGYWFWNCLLLTVFKGNMQIFKIYVHIYVCGNRLPVLNWPALERCYYCTWYVATCWNDFQQVSSSAVHISLECSMLESAFLNLLLTVIHYSYIKISCCWL